MAFLSVWNLFWVIRQVSTCELKHGRFTHSEVFFSNEIDEKNETNERITL